MIGCDCAVCPSDDPGTSGPGAASWSSCPRGNLLVDTSPEMRLQLRPRAGRAGPRDRLHPPPRRPPVRARRRPDRSPRRIGGPVPIYCEAETEETHPAGLPLRLRANGPRRSRPAGVPKIEFERIGPGVPFEVLGQSILPIRLEHGRFRVLGFRIGDLAYCTDVSRIPDESWPLLEGLDTLILDALRPEPHPTHFSLEQALAAIERLAAEAAYLTHLSHSFDHAADGGRPCPRAWLWPTMGSRWNSDRPTAPQEPSRDARRPLALRPPRPARPGAPAPMVGRPRRRGPRPPGRRDRRDRPRPGRRPVPPAGQGGRGRRRPTGSRRSRSTASPGPTASGSPAATSPRSARRPWPPARSPW